MREHLRQVLDSKIDWNGFWDRYKPEGHDYKPVPALSHEFLPLIDVEIDEIETSLLPIKDTPHHEKSMMECFVGMAAMFPMQDIGVDGFAIKHSILKTIFAEYPYPLLREACVDFAKTGEWFPRPKELIERIERYKSREVNKLSHLKELRDKATI